MKVVDLTGRVFGGLTVLEFDEKRHSDDITKKRNGEITRVRKHYICRCETCGSTTSIRGENLVNGNSGGCNICSRTIRHSKKHGLSHTKLGAILNGMKSRCYNKNNPEYHLYGGRGIIICDEWLDDNSNFYQWALQNGYDEKLPQSKQSIDRIDVNGNYCPENCRWANSYVQANNTRKNVYYEYNGGIHTLAEWARVYKINCHTLYNRINKLSWNISDAVTLPVSRISHRNKH